MTTTARKSGPFKDIDVIDLFGADAADVEDPGRLYAFFVENDSYDEIREHHPVSLVIGQKGIGKTALMRVSSFDDSREGTPNLFLKGYQVLAATTAEMGGASTLTSFKSGIESAIVAHVAGIIAKESSEAFGAPSSGGSLFARLAEVGSAVLLAKSTSLKAATEKLTPWLFSKVRTLNIYIDDTDVEWDGSAKAANKIAWLIQACFQICAENNGDVRFKISLRSDLFNYLKVTSDIIDKVQSGVVQCRWSVDQVFRVLAKRIAVHDNAPIFDENAEQETLFQSHMTPYFESRFNGIGVWENAPMRQVLLSFVRQRPRDLVGLCHLAAKSAKKSDTKIDTAALNAVFKKYSEQRFNDTVVEFRNEFPEIEKFLYEMRPEERKRKDQTRVDQPQKKRSYYTHAELVAKIDRIKNNVNTGFSYLRRPASTAELIEFMFRINFLVASRSDESGRVERLYYDFADDRLRETRLGKWDWEVHMAYRWAIQHEPEDIWTEAAFA